MVNQGKSRACGRPPYTRARSIESLESQSPSMAHGGRRYVPASSAWRRSRSSSTGSPAGCSAPGCSSSPPPLSMHFWGSYGEIKRKRNLTPFPYIHPQTKSLTVQHHHRPPQPLPPKHHIHTLQTLAPTPHGTLSPIKKPQEQGVEPAHNAQYKIILSAQLHLHRLIHFFPLCFGYVGPIIHCRMAWALRWVLI